MGAAVACKDVPPSSVHTCEEQAGWGKCSAAWMKGHCCKTCFSCADGCGSSPSPPSPSPGPLPPSPASFTPSDAKATEDTKALLSYFGNVSSSNSFIFAHHNSNFEGQTWSDPKCEQGRSDVIDSVGQFPGMVEYNFAKAAERNIDYMPHVLHAHSKGALVQFHWAASNPITRGGSHDLTGNPAVEILPGGKANLVWKQWLDTFAAFAHTVGTPLILRPFHEMTGGWFWWGTKGATASEYRALWNYTVSYLREDRGVHNVLFAYAPSKPALAAEVAYGSSSKSRYPGDGLVDIICFDHYEPNDFHKALLDDCGLAVRFAASHGKVPAICEAGPKSGAQTLNSATAATWYDRDFLEPVVGDEACSRVAWFLTWRNSGNDSYWVPLAGQPSYPGFSKFHQSKSTLFAGDFRLPYSSDIDLTLV